MKGCERGDHIWFFRGRKPMQKKLRNASNSRRISSEWGKILFVLRNFDRCCLWIKSAAFASGVIGDELHTPACMHHNPSIMPGVFFDLLSKFQISVLLQCEEKNGNEKKRKFLWRNIQISLSLSLLSLNFWSPSVMENTYSNGGSTESNENVPSLDWRRRRRRRFFIIRISCCYLASDSNLNNHRMVETLKKTSRETASEHQHYSIQPIHWKKARQKSKHIHDQKNHDR